MTERADMEAVIEAVLFVANDPVTRDRLVDIFGEREKDEAKEAVEAVVRRFQERPESGILIDEVAGGLRLMSRPDLHDYLRKFFEVSGANKLSMPALETLAIIAYRQPVTAPEIQELRSVNSSGVIKTLLERRLVRIAGRKEVVGKPFLYATTREFLLHFGLRSLKELPPLEQFEELFGAEAEMEQEMDPEEAADLEAADLEETAEEAAERARQDEEEWQREEEEARQLAQELQEDLEEPSTSVGSAEDEDSVGEQAADENSEASSDVSPKQTDRDESPADAQPESTAETPSDLDDDLDDDTEDHDSDDSDDDANDPYDAEPAGPPASDAEVTS